MRRKSNSLEDSEASIDADGLAFSTCGTTSLIIVITDAWIVCCNTGDSRAVLASEGVSKPLSRDHTPENPHERERCVGSLWLNHESLTQGKMKEHSKIGRIL